MNDKNSSSSSAGIGFIGVLQVAFIILKLCGVITWKWAWVLSPMWISTLAVVIVIFLLWVFLISFDKHPHWFSF